MRQISLLGPGGCLNTGHLANRGMKREVNARDSTMGKTVVRMFEASGFGHLGNTTATLYFVLLPIPSRQSVALN